MRYEWEKGSDRVRRGAWKCGQESDAQQVRLSQIGQSESPVAERPGEAHQRTSWDCPCLGTNSANGTGQRRSAILIDRVAISVDSNALDATCGTQFGPDRLTGQVQQLRHDSAECQ
ncbi:hypothetical protein B447_13094 [Thauera sp. 27]|nr:hypothetical protein B447_13094 [Thauera sp. 27]